MARRSSNSENQKKLVVLVRTIGERLRQARELCGLSQSSAALKLGYKNPSKLSKIERATDAVSIPLLLIPRAAKLYQVSMDFLFGLSLDWDNSPRLPKEREVGNFIVEEWERARMRDLQAIQKLNDRLDAIDVVVQTSVELSFEVREALEKFIALNPEFESEMRGGATLLNACEKQLAAAKEAQKRLRRFHIECRAIGKKETDQLELFEEEEGEK